MKKTLVFIFITLTSLTIFVIHQHQVIKNSLQINKPQVLGTTKVKTNHFEKNKLYSLINAYRKDNQLSPLKINQSLETSALLKANDMDSNHYFSHQDNNQLQSWHTIKTVGYEFKTAGENLASGLNTPWKVFDSWKKSKKHNEQLLNNSYQDMGLGVNCSNQNSNCTVVLHLGSR